MEIRKTERLYRLTDDNRIMITNRQAGFDNAEFDSGHRLVEHERAFKNGKPSRRIWLTEKERDARSYEMGCPTRAEAFEVFCSFIYQRRGQERA